MVESNSQNHCYLSQLHYDWLYEIAKYLHPRDITSFMMTNRSNKYAFLERLEGRKIFRSLILRAIGLTPNIDHEFQSDLDYFKSLDDATVSTESYYTSLENCLKVYSKLSLHSGRTKADP